MKTTRLAVLTAALLAPAMASAQITIPSNTPLAEVIPTLYLEEILSNVRCCGASLAISDFAEALVITGAISNQLSTFPVGSSAGGFTWTFNPGVGMFTRSTTSFGPLFAERAITVGRGKMNFGFNIQRTGYRSFEGQDLKDREILFYTRFPGGATGEDALSLDVSTTTFGLFGNYGVSDRLDVGVALPIINVDLDANIRFRFVNADGNPTTSFEQTISGGGSATGIGDVLLRGKYKVVDLPGGGVAAGIDVRLPTGDEENLLGIPGSQVKLFGIFSTVMNRVSPHVNFGYTFSRANDLANDPDSIFLPPPDEFNYAFGADFAVNSKLTVAGDLVGRALREMDRLSVQEVGLGPRLREFDFDESGTLNVALVSVGAKYNVWGNLLVSLNVLIPVTDGGLRPNVTPVLGFDYSF